MDLWRDADRNVNTKYCVEFQMGTMSVKVARVEAMSGASVKELVYVLSVS